MLAALIVLSLATGAVAATPIAPFHQCPLVGQDTSCALLVYVDHNGAVGVLGDPSQPVFDGVEDTLIGIQNDSAHPVATLPLAATSGKAIFGFDGDGICGVGLTPPGCPFGPTGYEGPNTSFSGYQVNPTTGTVNFSPAVPPGGHAYFALEEALATVPPFDILPGTPGSGISAAQVAAPANEPVVAVNPTNAKNVVVAFNHVVPNPKSAGHYLLHCGYRVSTDGGQHWTNTQDLAVPFAPGLTADLGGDPSLAFSSTGRLYFACLAAGDAVTTGDSGHRNTPTELYGAFSDNSGSSSISFSPSRIMVYGTDSTNTNGPDQEQLAAAPTGGQVYMCHTFYVAGTPAVRVDTLAAYPRVGTVVTGHASATAGTHQTNPQGCTLSISGDGRIWVGWWDSAAGTTDKGADRAYVAHSDDGGRHFVGVTAVGTKRGDDGTTSATFHPERHVYVQASPTPGDGRVLAVWEDNLPGAGVDLIEQALGSATGWAAPQPLAAGATQPSVAWGVDGKVAYGYYDNPNPLGSSMTFRLAQTSGPATGPLTGLSAAGNPSSELTNLGLIPRFGDYSGVAESGGTMYGAWTDNSIDAGSSQTVWIGHN